MPALPSSKRTTTAIGKMIGWGVGAGVGTGVAVALGADEAHGVGPMLPDAVELTLGLGPPQAATRATSADSTRARLAVVLDEIAGNRGPRIFRSSTNVPRS
jgi:hypothetical protein